MATCGVVTRALAMSLGSLVLSANGICLDRRPSGSAAVGVLDGRQPGDMMQIMSIYLMWPEQAVGT
jgi:hypothetical protein